MNQIKAILPTDLFRLPSPPYHYSKWYREYKLCLMSPFRGETVHPALPYRRANNWLATTHE